MFPPASVAAAHMLWRLQLHAGSVLFCRCTRIRLILCGWGNLWPPTALHPSLLGDSRTSCCDGGSSVLSSGGCSFGWRRCSRREARRGGAAGGWRLKTRSCSLFRPELCPFRRSRPGSGLFIPTFLRMPICCPPLQYSCRGLALPLLSQLPAPCHRRFYLNLLFLRRLETKTTGCQSE